MSDSTHVPPDDDKLRRQGLLLSHEFSRLEGRQPRVLVGKSIKVSQEVMRSVCSVFADMGFNVDIAPANSSVDDLALQCVENDADILFVLGANHMTLTQLTNLANKLAFYKLETVKALDFQAPLSLMDAKKLDELYRIFPEDANPAETSLRLLKILLTKS